jgi:hypothetical protein
VEKEGGNGRRPKQYFEAPQSQDGKHAKQRKKGKYLLGWW